MCRKIEPLFNKENEMSAFFKWDARLMEWDVLIYRSGSLVFDFCDDDADSAIEHAMKRIGLS